MKTWLFNKKPRAILRKHLFRFFCTAGIVAACASIIRWAWPDSNPKFGWSSLVVMFSYGTAMELADDALERKK
jgi:hypothetical protein